MVRCRRFEKFCILGCVFLRSNLSISSFFKKKTNDKGRLISYGLALLNSIVLTIIFILLLILVLGPWIGAFSFPVLFCLLIGSSIASIMTVYITRPKSWFPAVISSLILPVTLYVIVSVLTAEQDQLLVTFSEDITYRELNSFTSTETNIDGVKGLSRVDANGEYRIKVWFDAGLSDKEREEIVVKFDSLWYVSKLTDIKNE